MSAVRYIFNTHGTYVAYIKMTTFSLWIVVGTGSSTREILSICQSAFKRGPLSASKRDPFMGCRICARRAMRGAIA